nr:hypothetical protein [Tanacetum cinerariifolium]
MLPAEEQPLPAAVSPTAESPGYITESEPEMEPEENDGDDEKSEEDSIDYPTSEGDNDANDDGDDLSKDDVDDEDEEESSDSEEEEEEHLASTVPAPALYSSVFASEETEPFEEGILSLPEVDGINEGNGNDEVGSGVNIGNGIRNSGNRYDVGEAGDSGGVGMASNLSTSDSE